MIKVPLSLNVLVDFARLAELLLHSHTNSVKQSLLFDQWYIIFENLINLPQLLPVEID